MNLVTDNLSRELTKEHAKAKISYELFFYRLASKMKVFNTVIEKSSYSKLKFIKCISAEVFINGRTYCIYHWYGRKGIFIED